MAVFTEEMRKLTRVLVRTATGLEPADENYRTCCQFARSNFRFHRFLDVNDLEVDRRVRGLCEKFSVHAQPEKAEALEQLTKNFLSLNLAKNFPKSSVHYGVLLFLLRMSDSPLHSSYSPTPTPPPPHKVMGDNFDWAHYLMEGIEYPSYTDTDSEWSDLSEDSPFEEEEEEEAKGKSELNDSAVGDDLSDKEQREVSMAMAHSQLWLQEHITEPYWDTSHPLHRSPAASRDGVSHPACNLSANWTAYQQLTDPFFVPPQPVMLTEPQIVRETLWVLLGAEKSCVFSIGEDGVRTRENVQLPHLTPLSLRGLLGAFAQTASQLHKLRQFASSITERSGDYTLSHTCEAFADVLRHSLSVLSNDLMRIENDIIHNKCSMTLLKLSVLLRPRLREVEQIYEIFSKGVLHLSKYGNVPTAHQCSACLLSSLWSALECYDVLGIGGEEMVKLVLPLWVMTVRPYLAMADCWMEQGVLEDRHGEFFIERDSEVADQSPSYWEKGVGLRGAVPEVLEPILEKVLLAGKSVQLLKSIGKLREVELGSSSSHPLTPQPSPSSLYEEFLQSLQAEVHPQTNTTSPTHLPHPSPHNTSPAHLPHSSPHNTSPAHLLHPSPHNTSPAHLLHPSPHNTSSTHLPHSSPHNTSPAHLLHPSPHNTSSTHLPHPSSREDESFDTDPLMRSFLKTLHITPTALDSSAPQWQDIFRCSGSSLRAPLSVVIQRCLQPLFQRRYLKACRALIRVLRTDCQLTEHFRTVRLFFLMEAGDAMATFYSDIFERILQGEPWQEPSYLNTLLQEALQTSHPTAEKSLSVIVDSSEAVQHQSHIHSLSSISLHYEVPWPLDAVFSPPLMVTYNRVFHFLLQVKWAKWSLEGVRTRESVMAALPWGEARKLHLLHLLRAKLLHFVNNLNNYLMTRILHSIGLEFQQTVAEAEDLSRIILVHRDYVNTLYDRCLLNRKASYVKEAIMKILSLILVFRQKWEEGSENFSFAEAERMESEFSRCSHFLVSCLDNTVKRGTFPHLETLAFSLRSLKTTERIFTLRTIL